MITGDGHPGGPRPRPKGKETAKIEQAQIEADKTVALAKIAADVEKARIAADDDQPEKEAPSKTIRTLGLATGGIILTIGVVVLGSLAILYNVPFEGNPLTGSVRIGVEVKSAPTPEKP